MVYSFSRCPHCKYFLGKKTNPEHQIACPFERCPSCKKIYKNSYKEEWITKSPFKRLYFLAFQNGTGARAFIFPILLSGLIASINPSLAFVTWLAGSTIWLIVGYNVKKKSYHEDIEASLIRTQDEEYIALLRKEGYAIFPVDTNW